MTERIAPISHTSIFVASLANNERALQGQSSAANSLNLPEHNMPNPRTYVVELRNNSGTTISTHVYAHSEYEAIQLAVERNPGYRALSAHLR